MKEVCHRYAGGEPNAIFRGAELRLSPQARPLPISCGELNKSRASSPDLERAPPISSELRLSAQAAERLGRGSFPRFLARLPLVIGRNLASLVWHAAPSLARSNLQTGRPVLACTCAAGLTRAFVFGTQGHRRERAGAARRAGHRAARGLPQLGRADVGGARSGAQGARRRAVRRAGARGGDGAPRGVGAQPVRRGAAGRTSA